LGDDWLTKAVPVTAGALTEEDTTDVTNPEGIADDWVTPTKPL
jgi:hypothetical protein